jgi:hypothetical protein
LREKGCYSGDGVGCDEKELLNFSVVFFEKFLRIGVLIIFWKLPIFDVFMNSVQPPFSPMIGSYL